MEQRLDLSEAVQYHYGQFPPLSLDAVRLIKPLTRAAASLARYDQMLKGMHNSESLLAPLRSQEAVVSSRMEGTVSTLDEVLQYEADHAEDGAPLSEWLIRSAHAERLGFGRGARMTPGSYKTEQNYIADRGRRKVIFVPVSLAPATGSGLYPFFAQPFDQHVHGVADFRVVLGDAMRQDMGAAAVERAALGLGFQMFAQLAQLRDHMAHDAHPRSVVMRQCRHRHVALQQTI